MSEIGFDGDRPDVFFYTVRYQSVVCPLHTHRHMEIVLVDSGSLSFQVADTVYRLEAGCAVFLSPFTPHAFLELTGSCHVLMFSAVVAFFETFLNRYGEQTPLFYPSKESLSLVNRLLPREENRGGIFVAQAVLGPLLNDVKEQCHFLPKKETATDAIDAAVSYLDEHFADPIDLSEVAKAVGIHPVTLSRGFVERTKIKFTEYRNSLRCSYAVALMRNSEKSLAVIAFEAGFGSIRSFNRAFDRIYGMTPSHYRSRHE